MEPIAQVVGWVGLIATAFAAIVGGIRALVKGPKEDRTLEADIQQRVTAMADEWLQKAEVRLKEAERAAETAKARADAADTRAEAAEDELTKLKTRVTELEVNLTQSLETVDELWAWGSNGGGEPKPVLRAWIYERLHRASKGS